MLETVVDCPSVSQSVSPPPEPQLFLRAARECPSMNGSGWPVRGLYGYCTFGTGMTNGNAACGINRR